MDDKAVIIAPRRVASHAFVEFFRDLLAGDLVALSVCFGLVLLVAVISALGAWFLWQRKQAADSFKKRIAEKRKKESEEFKASKKPKEI